MANQDRWNDERERDWQGYGQPQGYGRRRDNVQGRDYGERGYGTSRRDYEDYDQRGGYGRGRDYGYEENGGYYGGYGGREAERGYASGDYPARGYGDYGRSFAGGRTYGDYGRRMGGYGAGGGYTPTPAEGTGRESRSWASPGPGGSLAGDEAQRGQWNAMHRGNHRGRGPKGYRRADDRIRDDVNDRLTDDPFIDATETIVEVVEGEVTLNGLVWSRDDKRRAEDLADDVSGVRHVQNNLRIARPGVKDSGQIVATAAGEPIAGVVADIADGDR
jgi:hypothetical protein